MCEIKKTELEPLRHGKPTEIIDPQEQQQDNTQSEEASDS